MVHLCQHAKFLSRGQREKLRSALLIVDPTAPHVPNQHDLNYDASFDLGSEVSAQIKAVRAIRSYVFDAKGNIRDGITSREAKEVISSGSTMLASLMKYHKDVMNMDRLRMLEQAVVEALQEYDPELREQVLKTLEEKLEIEDEKGTGTVIHRPCSGGDVHRGQPVPHVAVDLQQHPSPEGRHQTLVVRRA